MSAATAMMTGADGYVVPKNYDEFMANHPDFIPMWVRNRMPGAIQEELKPRIEWIASKLTKGYDRVAWYPNSPNAELTLSSFFYYINSILHHVFPDDPYPPFPLTKETRDELDRLDALDLTEMQQRALAALTTLYERMNERSTSVAKDQARLLLANLALKLDGMGALDHLNRVRELNGKH